MKKLLFIISLSAIVTLFISQFCYINVTASLPVGLYVKTNRPIKIGSIVVFQPDFDKYPFVARYLSSGLPLMKRVTALPGQKYQLPPASNTDSKGRAIKPWAITKGVVPANHIVVIGNTRYSLDSRYLGFISQSSIIDVVTPFLVWRK